MTTIFSRALSAPLILLFIVGLLLTPTAAQAADDDLGCLLITSTPRGYQVFEGSKEVEIRTGERVILAWIGINAESGKDREGKAIATIGLRILNAEGSGSYDFTFEKGSDEVTCTAELQIAGQQTSTVDVSDIDEDAGVLSVSSIPLLTGGVAARGASVPVAYIKVENTSSEAALINGFTLVQNGSADTDVITSFATNDDKGGSRTTVTSDFDGNEVYVPLSAVMSPRSFRIFTLKSNLSSSASGEAGQTLMLDVDSIDTGADVYGAFPIRGTTWRLGF
ncbi:hypothetical protein KJ819_01935 [Patescibacteria group bacterium]|nr:hypothetical protein [Patescibacteria group bacterium]MBU1500956.1 hypothetical protein [Patescibacteria group bacterium]MBU2080586.1 hypothetical protein [Patescibacteria group bacterium]MBU2124338.1 hypothetical protein [Patescibacteria group bacterium]MBU2194464.1 hypothetical protein [Patescibacteria group bacterium]